MTEVEFGSQVLGETRKRIINVTNNGALGTQFVFRKITGIDFLFLLRSMYLFMLGSNCPTSLWCVAGCHIYFYREIAYPNESNKRIHYWVILKLLRGRYSFVSIATCLLKYINLFRFAASIFYKLVTNYGESVDVDVGLTEVLYGWGPHVNWSALQVHYLQIISYV